MCCFLSKFQNFRIRATPRRSFLPAFLLGAIMVLSVYFSTWWRHLLPEGYIQGGCPLSEDLPLNVPVTVLMPFRLCLVMWFAWWRKKFCTSALSPRSASGQTAGFSDIFRIGLIRLHILSGSLPGYKSNGHAWSRNDRDINRCHRPPPGSSRSESQALMCQ